MSWDKEIKFPEKKVDASWKEDIEKAKGNLPQSSSEPSKEKLARSAPQPETKAPTAKPTSKPFLNLISSLGYQALMQMGEIPIPETGERIVQLEGAKEIIGLIQSVKEKTEGNLSSEEEKIITSLLSELHMKFASLA